MNTKKSPVGLLLMLCVMCGLTLFGAGSITEEAPIAMEMVGSSGIGWAPTVNYETLILTVSRPDGTTFRKSFNAGQNPYLELSDIHGTSACEGQYTYELRVIPQIPKRTRGIKEQSPALYKETLTQTGHFMVKGGILQSKGLSETPSHTMDVVHTDDGIITGSLCVGFDCLTDGSETFGLDTIKLKENSLRILFDDTSTGLFPANDWRIVANDSTSGGGSYWAVEDVTGVKTPFKITAGAKNSSIFVSSAGKVGFGTSTPIYNLHVVHGDSPTLRLEQDGSYGWSSQSWDIAGNETNFFIRDVTSGSKLPIRIQPGAPTNALTLKSDGRIGFGTWAPDYPIHLVTSDVNASIVLERTGAVKTYMNAATENASIGTATNHPVRLVINGAPIMTINTNGSLTMSNGASLTSGGTWTNASSRELKENIQSLSTIEALQALQDLNPVKYNYKTSKAEKHVGFIAEEVPELVASQDKKGMSPMDVVAVLTKVVQEQQKTIAQLQERIALLEKK